jgi:transcriptional regulator with XRE-family HTH domain
MTSGIPSMRCDVGKELRRSKGLSQKSMAEFLDMVVVQAYQKYEYGTREPNHETTIKVDYLLGRDTDEQKKESDQE